MTVQIHPLETTNKIRDTYLRYLKTLYPFQDPQIRDEFTRALETPNLLVKGPIVEISPAFELGSSIKDLVQEGVLNSRFSQLCSDELPYERKLYLHQEDAIRKVVAGKNIVVATGTGSGKTEAFIIPILHHLLEEEQNNSLPTPGIRALLLYPMNALANDQLKRLRRALSDYPSITFGRYTGETKHWREDAKQKFQLSYPNEPLLVNELHSREEMQETPPHILLTNYAMLEYLLLRPQDAPFFDGAHAQSWRFIVLDEAHVYDGAQGIEIAMLLRRLKDRVVQSEIGKLKFIATSATLGGGRKDYPAVAEFASDLFGEIFDYRETNREQQDVIEASRVSIQSLGPTWGDGESSLYKELIQLTLSNTGMNFNETQFFEILDRNKIPEDVITQIKAQSSNGSDYMPKDLALHALLKGDGRVHRLHSALAGNPSNLEKVAEIIFTGEKQASQLMVHLVALAVKARPSHDAAPLLPARYHVFARALEGAFLCLNDAAHIDKDQSNSPPRLFLKRHELCPTCRSPVFEVAMCARCGLTYLVGELRQGNQLPESHPLPYEKEKIYFIQEISAPDDLQP